MTVEKRNVVELRKPSLRRDMNELLFYRNGEVEHRKLWSNVGYAIVAYWMIVIPERVWQDWFASIAIASALIAPDTLIKIINLRQKAGAEPKK